MSDFNALSATLIEARELKAKAEEALKEANKAVEIAEKELFDSMVEAEVDKFSANGYTFSPDVKDYFTVPADHADAVHEAMVALNLGGIYKFTANAQTLQATLRELASQHSGALPEELAELVTVYNKSKVNVRKTGK